MSEFDPDKFLQEDVAEESPAFDPDTFLGAPEKEFTQEEFLAAEGQPTEMVDRSPAKAELRQKQTDQELLEGDSTLKRAGLAAMDQLPFVDHISSAGAAAWQTATEGKPFKETYSEFKSGLDQKQQAIARENPELDTLTRLGTEIGATVTGGAVVNKALKATGVVNKLAKITGASAKAMQVAGASASAVGSDFVYQGLLFSLALGKTFKMAGKILNATGVSDWVTKKLIANNVARSTKRKIKTVSDHLDRTGQSADDLLESVKRVGDADELLDQNKMLKMLDNNIGPSKGNLEAVYDELDVVSGEPIQSSAIFDDIYSSAKAYYAQAGKEVPVTLRIKFDELAEELSQPLRVTQAWRRQKFVKSMINSFDDKDLAKVMEEARQESFDSAVDSLAKKMDKASEGDIASRLSTAKKDYGNLRELSKATSELAEEEMTMASVGSAFRKAAYTTFALGPKAALAAGTLNVAKALIKPEKILAKSLNPAVREMGEKAGALGRFIEKNGDAYVGLGRLTGRLSNALMSDNLEPGADSEINRLVDQGVSMSRLYEQPLERSELDAKTRINDVYNAVLFANKDLANSLMDEHAKGGDLGPILDAISKLPEAKGLIKPGLGWNGKVYTDEDKAVAINKLRNEYPLIASSDRMLYEKAIQGNGSLPVWEELPQRKPMKFVPADKSKGSY